MRTRLPFPRAVAVTSAVLMLAGTAGTAHATPTSGESDYEYYKGRVVSPTSLKVRLDTDTRSQIRRTLPRGTIVDDIVCRKRGEKVGGNRYLGGNNVWYLLGGADTGLPGWVSARYVQNIGSLPRWCHANDHAGQAYGPSHL